MYNDVYIYTYIYSYWILPLSPVRVPTSSPFLEDGGRLQSIEDISNLRHTCEMCVAFSLTGQSHSHQSINGIHQIQQKTSHTTHLKTLKKRPLRIDPWKRKNWHQGTWKYKSIPSRKGGFLIKQQKASIFRLQLLNANLNLHAVPGMSSGASSPSLEAFSSSMVGWRFVPHWWLDEKVDQKQKKTGWFCETCQFFGTF